MASPMVFRGLRGRDGSTVTTLEIPQGLAVEVLNMDLDGSGLGKKRRGSTAITFNNSFPASDTLGQIRVHYPSADQTVAQIWGFGTGGTVAYAPVNTPTWTSAITVKDSIAAWDSDVLSRCVSFNGKFIIPFNSAADRMHVYEATTGAVRRMGLAAPSAAPTVANTGSGTYAATQRWYQQSYRIKNGTKVLAEGERSASVAFTPSGSGTAARVTKAASISESETHWVLWASETGTDGPFYELAETAVGTTTYDDSTAPSAYDNGTAAQPAGTFTVPTSAKYVLNDGGNRLLFAGSFEDGFTSRVWYTPALGSLGRGDDERIPNTTDVQYWFDLQEYDGGAITGLAGPINGQNIVFKERQMWRLVPTGDVDAPYVPKMISPAVGCIDHRSIAMGEDESGNPALYFSSAGGPYRFGANGLQYLGRDIEDIWTNIADQPEVWGAFYPYRHQYYLYVEHLTLTTFTRLRFHARLGRPDETGAIRGGWVRDAGTTVITAMKSLEMIPYSPNLTGAENDLFRPHVLRSGAVVRLDTTLSESQGSQDANSATFQAYVELGPQAPAGLGRLVSTGAPLLFGAASGTVTITVTQLKDFSAETRATTGSLTTTRGAVICDSAGGLEGCTVVAFRVGNATATSEVNFTLDALIVPFTDGGAVATV